MSGEAYGTGELGADLGFGYLDDDDDDGAGSTIPPSFSALISDDSFFSTVPTNGTATFSLVTNAGGSTQTSGVMIVKIGTIDASHSDYSSPISSIATTTLAGWSEFGWTYWSGGASGPYGDGYYWYNVYTKASVVVGSDTLHFAARAGGSVSTLTNVQLSEDQTAQASGPPQSYELDFKNPHMSATLTVPIGVNQGATYSSSMEIDVGDVALTSVAITVHVTKSDGTSAVTSSISTTTIPAGWTESGWTASGLDWVNTYSVTIASPGYSGTFVISAPVPTNPAIHNDFIYTTVTHMTSAQYDTTSPVGSPTPIN